MKARLLRNVLLLPAMAIMMLYVCLACHSEDYSFCPPEPMGKVKLEFRLFNDRNFNDYVTSVEVGIFDSIGNLVERIRIEREQLLQFPGMEVDLPVGRYQLVFWGNVGTNTKIDGILPTDRVTYSSIVGNPGVVGSADDVWYAPAEQLISGEEVPMEYYSLTVVEDEEYSGVVYFTQAHRSFEIYIKGFADVPNNLPTVELTGLPAGLNYWGMGALTDAPLTVSSSHTTAFTTINQLLYAATSFHTFMFDDMDGMEIIIRDHAGNEILRIPLADAVVQSGADPDSLLIQLIFDFSFGTLVEITTPDWNSGEIGVGL